MERVRWEITVSDRRPKFQDFVKFIKERTKLVDNEFGRDMNTRPSKETIFRRSKVNQSRPFRDSSTFSTGTGPSSGRQNKNERGPDFVNKQAPCFVVFFPFFFSAVWFVPGVMKFGSARGSKVSHKKRREKVCNKADFVTNVL